MVLSNLSAASLLPINFFLISLHKRYDSTRNTPQSNRQNCPKGVGVKQFFYFLDLQGVCGATFVFLTSSALVMCADFCGNELGEGSFCSIMQDA